MSATGLLVFGSIRRTEFGSTGMGLEVSAGAEGDDPVGVDVAFCVVPGFVPPRATRAITTAITARSPPVAARATRRPRAGWAPGDGSVGGRISARAAAARSPAVGKRS